MDRLTIGAEPLCPGDVVRAVKSKTTIKIHAAAMDRMTRTRAIIDRIAETGTPVYGVNTGVGSQKDHAVPSDAVLRYNRDLIRAHSTRVPGPTAPDDVVRATLILMINEHCHGYSGISPALVGLMVTKTNEDPLPQIDASGSVGASDLVPLAQISEWLLSDPRAAEASLPQAKDALSLINCNAFSLANGCLCLAELQDLISGLEVSAALSLEGIRANLDASLPIVSQTTARTGQHRVSAVLSQLLKESALHQQGASRFLQDPLSFRNIPQVLGAVRECADWFERTLGDELASNAVNPMIDLENGVARSHGNMDTTRLTLAVDMMRQALGKAADLSGERIHKQQWPAFSGLPIGLAADDAPTGGVQYLNLGHIAASLITSVKIWAAPHLLHSVGQVADGVEDTASNAVHAIADLRRQIDAVFKIVAIEASIAIWAIDRRGLDAQSIGAPLRPIFATLRAYLPIGREGAEVFDLTPTVESFREITRSKTSRICEDRRTEG